MIAITNNAASPLGQACDYHITTATGEAALRMNSASHGYRPTGGRDSLYLFLAVSKKDSYEHIRRHEIAISEDKNN